MGFLADEDDFTVEALLPEGGRGRPSREAGPHDDRPPGDHVPI
jgi:hypothetical protein